MEDLYNYPGSYSEFVKLKEERQNMALATQRKRKSLLRTELEWLSRGARARSTKQKAHIDRIQSHAGDERYPGRNAVLLWIRWHPEWEIRRLKCPDCANPMGIKN